MQNVTSNCILHGVQRLVDEKWGLYLLELNEFYCKIGRNSRNIDGKPHLRIIRHFINMEFCSKNKQFSCSIINSQFACKILTSSNFLATILSVAVVCKQNTAQTKIVL